jgi:hypothetical protein
LAVFSDLKATGFSGHKLDLEGGLLDLDNGRRELVDLKSRGYSLTPHAGTSDTRQTNIWVELPTKPGTYLVVERVYSGEPDGRYWGRGLGAAFTLDGQGRVTEVKKR